MAQNFGSPATSNTKGIQEALRQALGLAIDVPFADYVNYLGTEWSPSELFSNGERGAWYEAKDISTLSQDADGTIPVTSHGDPVGRMLDKSGNNVDAVQPISAKRMVYKISPPRNVLDKVDDEFVINVPAGGWIGTMVIAASIGTASYGVDIPAGNYALGGKGYPSDTMIGVLFRHGELTESEKSQAENYFVRNGAVDGYINETDFSDVWRDFISLTRFPLIDTSNATDFSYTWGACESLTSFPMLDVSKGTNFRNTWMYCVSLTEFPMLDVSKGTNFEYAWYRCLSLTSFPILDVSNSTNFRNTWGLCMSLTSFPMLDVSKGISFSGAWSQCTGLTSFPLLNTSSGTNFTQTWYDCTSLTSFPLIDMSSATNFIQTWRDCKSLVSFPLNCFDNAKTGEFLYAFTNTNLNQESIDGILVSLVVSGVSTGIRRFNQSGGSAPSIVGEESIDTLRSRGWSIAVTGGY